MSGLAAVLAGRRPPGIYRWAGAHAPDEVRHVVEHAGWTAAEVDGWTHPGKVGLLRALGSVLALPAWYGENFDALADCLRDLPGRTVLVWDGWATLAREDHQAFHTALDVLAERSALPDAPAFVVLLLGPGPDLDDLPAVGLL